MNLIIERLDLSLPMPEYKHEGDAGFDLYCAWHDYSIGEDETRIIPLGIRCNIPDGYELQIRPRSSVATAGVVICNSPGTIDSGYRGEIKVPMRSWSNTLIKHGDRIAQAVLAPVTRANIIEGSVYTDTSRGEDGFGSTGT